ncbi:MAG: hypothetical protein D6741_21645 [Planctomycetota bacterium]|nr:MAG: hypothetical protein D6741_21645 [Planctomycetota bacterium]
MLSIRCPHCTGRLKVPSEAVGALRRCPLCGKAFTVRPPAPRPQDAGYETVEPGDQPAEKYVGAICPTCNASLYAPVSQAGTEITCEDCGARIRLPDKATASDRNRTPLPSASTEDEYELADADWYAPDRLRKNKQKYVSTTCGRCGTRVTVERSRVGTTVPCPDCDHPVLIREPPPAEKPSWASTTVRLGSTYGVKKPVPVEEPEYRFLVDPERAKDRFMVDRELPDPPRFPFLSGVWTYPFYRSTVLPMVSAIGAGVLAAGLLELVAVLWQGLSLASIAVVLLLPAAAAFGLFWLFVAGFAAFGTIAVTSEGYDQVEGWSETPWLDRVGVVFYFAFPLGETSILASLVAGAAQQFGGNPVVAGAVAVAVFYPVLLLSVLERGSPFEPYSAIVWVSLFRRAGVWLRFHLTGSVPVGLCAAGLWWLRLRIGGLACSPIEAVVITYLWMVYHRLLGRVGWYLNQTGTPAGNSSKRTLEAATHELEVAGQDLRAALERPPRR